MKNIYQVTLTADERLELTQLVSKGKCDAPKIKHANTLLAVDETANGRVSDQEVAKQFHCHVRTVANIREHFVEEGLEAVHKPKTNKLD